MSKASRDQRIYFVTKQANTIGGVQNIVRTVAECTRHAGCQVQTISFGEQKSGLIGRLEALLRDMFSFIRAILRSRDCRVVFTTTGYQLIPLSLLALIARRRIYFWEHGDPSFFQLHLSSRLIRKYLYPHASAVVALHKEFAKKLERYSPAVRVIPNPVPQLVTDHSRTTVSEEARRVVWVGRVSTEKQPRLAFDALALSANAFPDTDHFFICPNGETGFEKFSIPDNLQVINGNHFKYSEWFGGKTILLFTSIQEAMPGVIFEALSMGAHVITTECSPWISDIGDYVSVDLVRKESSAAEIADAIATRLRQRCNLPSQADRRNELLSKYDQHKVTSQWLALFE